MGLVVAAFAVVSLVWGSTYFAIRVALDSYPPFLLGAARFVLAGGLMLAFARARGVALPSRREWASALLTGALFFVVGNGLVNVAEQSVSSGLVSVLVATMPLWAAFWSRIYGSPVTRDEAFGIALGLGGVAVMNLGGDLRANPFGTLCGVFAPVGWALGTVMSKRLPLPESMTMRTGAQMLAGGLSMLLVALLKGEQLADPLAPRALAALAYLTVFGSILGFTAYSYLLKHTRPSVATSYAYVNPVIAVGIGVLFAGERLDLASAAGAALVLAAVVLVARARRDNVPSPELPEAQIAACEEASPRPSRA